MPTEDGAAATDATPPRRDPGCALALAALFDACLIAVAWLAETEAARAWLADNKLAVVRAAGLLHVIAFPALMLEVFADGTRAGELLTDRESLAAKLFPWAGTGFYATSFIAPVAFGLAVAQEPYLALFMGYVFGPLALSGLGMVAMLLAEKRRGKYRPVRLGGAWYAGTVLLILSYLSLTEYILVYAQAQRGVFSGLMCLGAVFVSYVPMRAYFFLVRARHRAELVPLAVAFANLLYLLARA